MTIDLNALGITGNVKANKKGEVHAACPFCRGKHEKNSKRK